MKQKGTLTISNPTGDVSFSIEGEPIIQYETWVINKTPTFPSDLSTTFTNNFVSNNNNYNKISFLNKTICFNDIVIYGSDYFEYPWLDEVYRTIRVELPIPDALLIWLNSSAVKQPTTSYGITTTLTNCTSASSNPVNIIKNASATLSITPLDNYNLSPNINVLGVGSYNWDNTSGLLTLNNPLKDVEVEAKGEFKDSLLDMTWLPNPTINISSAQDYNINFYFYGTDVGNKRTSSGLTISTNSITYKADGTYSSYLAYNNGSWVDAWSYVISFTGGSDINNASLRKFLTDNGILVPTITDVANKTFKMLPAIDVRSFNAPSTGTFYQLNATATCSKYSSSGPYIGFIEDKVYLTLQSSTYDATIILWPNVWEYKEAQTSSQFVAHPWCSSYADPGLTVTIGPSSSQTKILRVINWFQTNSYHK